MVVWLKQAKINIWNWTLKAMFYFTKSFLTRDIVSRPRQIIVVGTLQLFFWSPPPLFKCLDWKLFPPTEKEWGLTLWLDIVRWQKEFFDFWLHANIVHSEYNWIVWKYPCYQIVLIQCPDDRTLHFYICYATQVINKLWVIFQLEELQLEKFFRGESCCWSTPLFFLKMAFSVTVAQFLLFFSPD